MSIYLRPFHEQDIPYKVKWINDPETHRYLHYDIPLREDATLDWFHRIRNSENRVDMTILYNDTPIGIAGLLQISSQNKSAELYITLGEKSMRRKGFAALAMEQLLRIAFSKLRLHRVFLYAETENIVAIRSYERFGFIREGCLRNEIMTRTGAYADRYIYSILKPEFEARYGHC